MICETVIPLIPSYLDDELSESQAAPVRQHLLDCAECRKMMQAQTAEKSWFVPTESIKAPAGFAARISRRAFAGDQGFVIPAAPENSEASESNILQFAIQMTAVAAAVLLLLALGLKFNARPGGAELRADSSDLREALEAMDRLNRQERLGLPGEETPGNAVFRNEEEEGN